MCSANKQFFETAAVPAGNARCGTAGKNKSTCDGRRFVLIRCIILTGQRAGLYGKLYF